MRNTQGIDRCVVSCQRVGLELQKKFAPRGTAKRHNGWASVIVEEKMMPEKPENDAQPEALATFAAAARGQGVKPVGQGISATAETAGKPGDLEAEEKDAADILGGNATGDTKRVDAAIADNAKRDKRAG